MTTVTESRTQYIQREYGELVGKTIKTVRPLMKSECEDLAWAYEYEHDAMLIVFTDGTAVVPMCDPEGNGAGHLLITDTKAQ